MYIINDSMTIVLLGDWNKSYIQPDWMAENVYESSEIEIGIEGQGTDLSVSYRNNGIVIKPTQTKIEFSANNTDSSSIETITKYINNYLTKSTTPNFIAYGFNVEYVDSESMNLSEVFDSMSDTEKFIEMGYAINTTTMERNITKDGKNINIQFTQNQSKTVIHFNQHFPNSEKNIILSETELNDFLSESAEILKGLGYEMETE